MSAMPQDVLFVFGAKSTALEIAELSRLIHPDCRITHVVGEDEPVTGPHQIHLGQLSSAVSAVTGRAWGILSMSRHDLRTERARILEEQRLEARTLIHPQATVSISATIGRGCYIAAGARISVNARIGEHSMLNLNATFGHDSASGAHLVVNPGACIGGNVRIGERVLIGANAFVHQGLSIGDDGQVDAMTYLWRDLEARTVATSRSLRQYPRIDLPRG